MAIRRQRVNFEAVTVSAAARLIQLRRARTLSAEELAWYLAELTDLDPITTCQDGRVLGRLASRYVARGGAAAPTGLVSPSVFPRVAGALPSRR